MSASILTIGNELVSGDVPNTNAAWLARRLAPLGVEVRLAAALPDEIDTVAAFVRAEAPRVDFLLVTGGLGGTPDDLTREALADTFGVAQVGGELGDLFLRHVERVRDRLAREIVGRAAEPAGDDEDIDARRLAADELGDHLDLVGHRGEQARLDAERREPLRDPRSVRVGDVT